MRPGLANLQGRLLGLSSPHSRRGHLHQIYRQHYAKDCDVLGDIVCFARGATS